jgi:hypothetical protein
VSWRLVNDGVKSQTAIINVTMVPREQALLPEVIRPDGRTLDGRVRDGLVKRTGERYNTFRSASIWSGSEAQTSPLG